MPAMAYRVQPAPAGLEEWVECVWSFEREAPASVERVVPDGRCELIVQGAASFSERGDDGLWRTQPRVLFAGQVTRPLHVRANGAARVIGVRFRYAGARAFFGRPLREATDRRIGLDAGFEDASVECVADFVRERVDRHRTARDPVVEEAVSRIAANGGDVAMAELAAASAVGRRQLERRFADAVGVGPALLAAIVRFRRVFEELDRRGARPWTDAALAAGYSDQSHFIREFRRFVGCTPGEFLRESRGLANALVDA
jgi:AraC-like DNA-binding protein